MTQSKTTAKVTAWKMLSSIYVATAKARAQARREYNEATIAHANKHPVTLSTNADILEVLSEAERNLEFEIRRIARSNDLSVPDVSEIR